MKMFAAGNPVPVVASPGLPAKANPDGFTIVPVFVMGVPNVLMPLVTCVMRTFEDINSAFKLESKRHSCCIRTMITGHNACAVITCREHQTRVVFSHRMQPQAGEARAVHENQSECR